MRKGSGTKTALSVTVDKDLVARLKRKLTKQMIKTSSYIERLIERDLNEK